jgi:hypothetical protein
MAAAILHAYFMDILPEFTLHYSLMKMEIVNDSARLPASACMRVQVASMVRVVGWKRQAGRCSSLSSASSAEVKPIRWRGSFTTAGDATRSSEKPLRMPQRCVSNEENNRRPAHEPAACVQ